jgi:hypothetical protein
LGKKPDPELSRVQAVAVQGLVGAAKGLLKGDVLAEVSALIAEVPWTSEEHLHSILKTLETPVVSSRRTVQDYTGFHSYLPDSVCAVLDGASGAEIKLEYLANFLIKSGITCPSEPTSKRLASLWLCATHSDAELSGMSVATKLAALSKTKHFLKAQAGRAPQPAKHIQRLPRSPSEFRAEHPRTWAATYGDEFPSSRPSVTVARLDMLDCTFGCRGGAKAAKPSSGPSEPASPIEKMAMTLMHHLMLQASGAQQQSPPKNELQLLFPPPKRRQLALPATEHVGQELAAVAPSSGASGASMSSGDSDHCGGMQALVDAPVSSGSCGGAASSGPSGGAASSGPSGGAASSGSSARLDDILLALKSRKPGDKDRNSCKESKESTSNGQDAAAKSKVVASKHQKCNKAGDKASVSNIKGSQGKSKVAVASETSKKSKGKTSEATAGCSKCRWSARGCGKCRDPAFRGLRAGCA